MAVSKFGRSIMKNDKRYLISYWQYLKKHRLLLGLAIVLIPLLSFFNLAQPYLIKKAIDDAILVGDVALLYWITLLFGLCVLFDFLSRTLQVFLFQYIGQKTVQDIRADLFKHVLKLSARYYDRTPLGVVTSRLTSDIESLNESFASGLVTLLADLLTLIGIIFVMFMLSPQLTFITLLILPPMVLVVNFFRIKLRAAFDLIRLTLGKMNGYIQEQFQGIDILQLFQQEKASKARFKELNTTYKTSTLSSVSYDAMLYSLIDSLNSIVIAVIIWYGWGQYYSNGITLGVLVAFVDYIQRFFTPLKEISQKFAILQHALASLDKIFSTFDIKDYISSGNQRLNDFQGQVSFDSVSFAYRGFEDKPVLNDVSFSLKQGQLLALVGPTGSGKTTVLRLLSKLYDGYTGKIMLDSTDLNTLNLTDVRQLIAVVNQETTLFSQSIAFNITLGNPLITKEKMIESAQKVHVHDFIMSLPGGYDYCLTQGNRSLSAGQAQLISFARALASDSPIILLDEATASVDSLAEKAIQQGLDALLADKTAIVVAHRLSTIQHADLILAFNNGSVIEYGDHKTLMKQAGFYAKLFKMQFADS
jgi:ATP-binding cassette subfamily B multidrug efflux pump